MTLLALLMAAIAIWPSIYLSAFPEFRTLFLTSNFDLLQPYLINHGNDALEDGNKITRNEKSNEVLLDSSVPVVAYVVTITHCQKPNPTPSSWLKNSVLQNSGAVFQRAIQLASFPTNPNARYGSKFYAITYDRDYSQLCAEEYEKMGFTVLRRPLPVEDPLGHLKRSYPNMEKKFPGKYPPRPIIEDDGCCGPRELLKLRMYELVDHPVVVHLDLDSLVLQPLDELFDVIVHPADTPQGAAARQHLVEANLIAPTYNRPLPDQIDAFYTKDWCSAKPKFSQWVGIQGGFMVARPSLDVYEDYKRIISEGNYTLGLGAGSGWGSAGYGRQIVGSMTFQGITPYYYEVVNRTGVELHRCKFNHMSDNPRLTINARYPRPSPIDPDVAGFSDGACRDGRDNCEDVQCQTWDISDARSIHFTNCLKPWDCPDPSRWNNTLVERNCRRLHREWFKIRQAIQEQSETNAAMAERRIKDSFEPDMFLGFCNKSGSAGYIPF